MKVRYEAEQDENDPNISLWASISDEIAHCETGPSWVTAEYIEYYIGDYNILRLRVGK